MTLDLFNGDQDACGLTTSGGTESILIGMLAYREWGKARGIKNPNIVATNTAHAAFDKSCFYFGIELRKVAHKDFLADIEGMRKLIDKNTVCLIASSPDYAFGNYDPVPAIAAMA
jgi:sphinganine-1-phosphate aldolase